ncbi:MAG: tRNA (N(6)-L-threonylcarbamoyladenosine(37)-C(2))-methylthiotransferase MtaB [Hyphomicrobiaceae bacterium]|nr:tRNA (N(6)-L-threonylcarbamoyladenosine(37)-C(2))-methylthiotransferase MtaB [Hyphomicrobiaceae bacterium]
MKTKTEPTVVSLGCRLNAYEAEVMRGHARAAELEDAIIVNTCAVTAEAVRQARQTIRRLRREKPEARIIVTGCAAQTEPETFAAMGEVDHVIGNDAKLEAKTFVDLLSPDSERVRVNDIMSVTKTASHLLSGFGGRTRAFVQVQNGCDHRCTFCIIPFGRGPSRSVPAGEVVAEVRRLVAAGTREIVLTGVDITSYGRDLPGALTLGGLVRKILRLVPELPRLRLTSIDQVEADADLLIALAEEERLMPHLHLSMQAGDDLILKRMKRRHLRADAIAFCAEARRLRPDIVFGADLIAGFPTETEAMFGNTLDLIEDCGLTFLHVFPFSPRPGTPAARMPQVDRTLVKQRAGRLRERGEARRSAFLSREIGQRRHVLVEALATGRTEHYAEVTVPADLPPGVISPLVIAGSDGTRLTARLEVHA